MLSIDTETLSKLLSEASRGHFGISKASEIQESATNAFGINFAIDEFAFQIKQIIAQINFIEKQLEKLEAEISTLLRQANSVITTITGICDVPGAIIIGKIGDISHFNSAPQLVAYAGLDPSVNQSGNFAGTKTKISKRGSPYLRRAILPAASTAAFRVPSLSVYYQSLKARKKHHLTAIGAVARKMCNIIFMCFGIINPMCTILNRNLWQVLSRLVFPFFFDGRKNVICKRFCLRFIKKFLFPSFLSQLEIGHYNQKSFEYNCF